MKDDARLQLAIERVEQAADLLKTAAHVVKGGKYENCGPMTYRRAVLNATVSGFESIAKAVLQGAAGLRYVKDRLENAPSQ